MDSIYLNCIWVQSRDRAVRRLFFLSENKRKDGVSLNTVKSGAAERTGNTTLSLSLNVVSGVPGLEHSTM